MDFSLRNLGVVHVDDTPYTKVQLIKVIQRKNDTLDFAEIAIYPKSDPTVNIAPTHATCFTFPINEGYYWGSMDEHGFVTRLNDDDLTTDSLNGPTGDQPAHFCWSEPCFHWCYLRESIEIDRVTFYPPQNNWRFYRTTDIKVEMYESVEFAVSNYTETSANYTMLDAATLGAMVYSEDHISMTQLTNTSLASLSVSILKMTQKQH